MWIISSCRPLFSAWSAFSLPGIPVWPGIQLIVGLCINLDAASLMALVIVFKCSFLLFSVFTTVKESVCIVIVSLVFLAFSSANRMAVISAFSTDTEALSLMMTSPFLCTTAAATRVPSLERGYWMESYAKVTHIYDEKLLIPKYHLSSIHSDVFQQHKYVLMVHAYPKEMKVTHHIDRQQC